MAHKQQFDYISNLKQKFPNFFTNTSVLEIGSLDLNGSIRGFFHNCFYIGLDLELGPGVDVACIGHEYKIPNNTFDFVVSTECFEHDPYWLKTFSNMIRMCRVNGLVVFTCATTGRAEHGTIRQDPGTSPFSVNKGWDYYKNLTQEDFSVFDFDVIFSEYQFETNDESHDLYFYGIKK